MNVLSLFDGISCGQLALSRAGIKVNKYYASEIDEHCIKVTQYNYPDTIQIGNVVEVKGIKNIDLLIGGSPCQGFSCAGKQLNFNDPRSKLFFDYIRILKECKPKWFLLENVKMKKEYQEIITEYIGVKPVYINSEVLSKQNRPRLYWTNIPIAEIKVSHDNFDNYLYRLGHGYISEEIKFFKKYPSLAAQSPATKYRIVVDLELAMNATKEELIHNSSITRSATPEECEEFQTLPKGYTKILNKTQRYKAIGNGWTVDVIAHIFKGLK
jgi:site-specific DNA-cytosine methylase